MSIELQDKIRTNRDFQRNNRPEFAAVLLLMYMGLLEWLREIKLEMELSEILRKENYSKGVVVRQEEDKFILICT